MKALSILIARKRTPFILRHPRWCGALWFASCAALSGVLLTYFLRYLSSGPAPSYGDSAAFVLMILLGVAICLASLGCVAAVIAGATTGARMLLEPKRSSMSAVALGAKVVFLSHVYLGMIAFLISGVSAIWTPLSSWASLFELATVFTITGLLGGIVTFPVGCLGAWLLNKYRHHVDRPVGCSVHGLRGDLEDVLLK